MRLPPWVLAVRVHPVTFTVTAEPLAHDVRMSLRLTDVLTACISTGGAPQQVRVYAL